MMELDFYIFDPTGNITAIVETPVLRESQSRVARLIMEEFSDVEQVAFVEKPAFDGTDIAIRMMGGEFCGNAAICSAVLSMLKSGAKSDGKPYYQLEVSGADKPLRSDLKELGADYSVSVDMPLPCSVDDVVLSSLGKSFLFPRVRFEGITHLIARGNISAEEAESAISGWCSELSCDALGILFLNGTCMSPFVYVASTDSRIWEGSCASGTCAVAAYMAVSSGSSVDIELSEPGGVIGAHAVYTNCRFDSIRLKSKVKEIGKFKLQA